MTETENKPKEQAPASQAKASGQNMQARPCPKDCRRCSWQQQICCASMLSFQAFDVMNSIIQRLDVQAERLDTLEKKVQAISSSEAELGCPQVFQEDLFGDKE